MHTLNDYSLIRHWRSGEVISKSYKLYSVQRPTSLIMAAKNQVKPGLIQNLYQRWSNSLVKGYLLLFCEKSGIHGFFYFAQSNLMALEKYTRCNNLSYKTLIISILNLCCRLFWLLLIISAFYLCTLVSLQSWDRYQTKSTVITVEKDYYYWNTTLPSLTICPQDERINKSLFFRYCDTVYPNLSDGEREDFYTFLESLANSTYFNFENIKEFPVVEVFVLNYFLNTIINFLNFFFAFRN